MSVKDYPSQAAYGRRDYVVINASMGEKIDPPIALRHDEYLIIRDCNICGNESRVIVPAQGLWDWEHGKFVQQAMPDLNPEQREMVMTGTHLACWDSMMGGEE